MMGKDKGYPGALAGMFSWFDRRHLLIRLSVTTCLDRRLSSELLSRFLGCVAFLGDAIGLEALTRYLYSGIANLAYWQGVSDELGGGRFFRQAIAQQRKSGSEHGYGLVRTPR